jgi:hypothetical protein
MRPKTAGNPSMPAAKMPGDVDQEALIKTITQRVMAALGTK